MAIRAAPSVAVVVCTRTLVGRTLRICRGFVSTSSSAYALACDLIAWSLVVRVEAEQLKFACSGRRIKGPRHRLIATGFGLLYLGIALPLGVRLRPLMLCHFGCDILDCFLTTFGILLVQLGLLRMVVRLPDVRRALGYQRALEACLIVWEKQAFRTVRFVPARSLCWSGPRCFLEAALGGIAVTELCESVLSLLVPASGAPNAGTLTRFVLASTFAIQWSMVLCLMRRRGVAPPAPVSRWMGLTPSPPSDAQHLVMLALEQFERGLPQVGRLPETQRGLWPDLAGAPMRERTKRCSINWWHSRPDSKSSTAA